VINNGVVHLAILEPGLREILVPCQL